MRNKVAKIIAIVIVFIFGGAYIYNKLTKPSLGPKTAKLYQHGFQLLEEQLGTYIKEYYSGVEKIEFSPIYVTEEGSTFSNVYIRPTIYDKHGNKATLGTKVKNVIPSDIGIVSYIIVDFDGDGNEAIELTDSNGKFIDVSNEQHLPNEVKLTRQELIDENIELLEEDAQLKGVVKDGKGSPNAEIVYNVNLSKANEWNDFIWSRNKKIQFHTKNNIRKSKDASLSIFWTHFDMKIQRIRENKKGGSYVYSWPS